MNDQPIAKIIQINISHCSHMRIHSNIDDKFMQIVRHGLLQFMFMHIFIIILMSMLISDMIYRDLKEKGLELTNSTIVKVPQSPIVKPGILKKLSSMITRNQVQHSPIGLTLTQIMYSCFLATSNNSIFIYKYTFAKELTVTHESTLTLPYSILGIYTCSIHLMQDKDIPILIHNPSGLAYFSFDAKQNTIVQRNTIKVVGEVIGAGWVSDRDCVALIASNTGAINIVYYSIAQGVLTARCTKPANLVLGEGEIVKKIWVTGIIDEHQDSLLPLFYAVVSKQSDFSAPCPMKLRIKQYIRTLQGELIQSPYPNYTLQTQSLQYSSNFKLVQDGDYYCLQLKNQVLIAKKKFDKYMLMDNMMEVMSEHKIRLCQKGLVVSIGSKVIELNSIMFQDPKCINRILDVIQLPQEMKGSSDNFRGIWPIIVNKEYTLIFVFADQNKNQVKLCGLVKMEPMHKVLALAKKVPHNQLEIIQDMALNLGIQKKDFYLKLWSTSKKQNSHIYQYLLPCKDVSSIKKQLKNVLRTRTIQVSQMLNVLQKISQINQQSLRTGINQKNYMEYVKNQFLRKKIRLNQVNKMLDYRIFDKIYSSSILDIFKDIVSEELDPVQPKFDPLHSSLNYQPIKELKTLQSVLQEFKVVLLQEYKSFLIQFLSCFPNKIIEILTNFPFLLPNHPFEIEVQKPSKTNEPILIDPKSNNTPQQVWFQTVSVSEWQAEATKQKIQKRLLHCFPTSKVTETVDQFYNSQYGRENKLWKHGLITMSLDEYGKKLKTLSGVQLYLDVCQFANELSVANNGDPKISQKILQILKQKNGLAEPHMHYCKLYANMHYFMLRNKIIPKSKLQISYLTNLKPQNLVAIFFLQNKQRKQHIFADFKSLYQDKNEFKQILEKFVQSENCSRIQLQILMKQIKNKGEKFQQDNQDIIEILITGICMKVEIRQNLLILDIDEDQQEDAPCLIDEIQLNKVLALKINRVKRLKLCKDIFKCFGLQKMTYKQLLDLEQNNEIFKLILGKYLSILQKQDREGQLEVTIQDEQRINLQNPRSMLTVLVYLQENIYYSAKPIQIVIIFGLELITWKKFEIVRNLINDQNALTNLQINRDELVEQLTLQALEVIYLDPEILYEDQTPQQIINILNIDDETTPLKIRETAKLDLVQILSGWGLQVHPSDIHTICTSWKQDSRQQFMEDLINKYIKNLTFRTFQEIYRLLEITDKEVIDVNILNSEYVQFCDFYARKLLEVGRYKEASQVVAFLMDIQDVKVQYTMLAETYLQNIIQIFGKGKQQQVVVNQNKEEAKDAKDGQALQPKNENENQEHVGQAHEQKIQQNVDHYQNQQQTARKLIQLFVQKYETSEEQVIKMLLKQQFSIADTILRTWEGDRSASILIDYRYCYDQSVKFDCRINYDDLWEMAKKEASNTSQLYYNFFFLALGLSNPKKGFSQTVGISYNLDKLAKLLTDQLDKLIDRDESLWFVNYTLLQMKFLWDGMLGQAAHALNIIMDKDKQNKEKLQLIIKQLRIHRAESPKNEKIYNILNKLRVEILSKSKMSARKERYRRKLKQSIEKEQQRQRELLQSQNSVQQPQEDNRPEVYLNWKKLQQQKKHLSSVSQYIMSQKELIDKVFEMDIETSRIKSPKKQEPEIKHKKILEGLFQIKGNPNDLMQMVKNGDYEQVGKYPLGEVYEAVEKIFEQDTERDYREMPEILENLNIGDPTKLQVFQSCKSSLDFLPNQIRKTLFPISFFTSTIPSDIPSQSKPLYLFSQLKPQLHQLLGTELSISQMREIGGVILAMLNTPEFVAEFYLQQLVSVAESCSFDSSSAIMAHECVIGMVNSCPQFVSQYYRQILGWLGKADIELKRFVKQLLSNTMSEKMGYSDVAELIKNYEIQETIQHQ